MVARAVPGRSLRDVIAWYYAVWKRHRDYSAWKAWGKWLKRAHEVSDFHRDECCVCGQGGDLLCCDWCALAYHVGCVGAKSLAQAGEDDDPTWMCPACTAMYAHRGVVAASSAQVFVSQEVRRHEALAAHHKGLRAWTLATRNAWRGASIDVCPDLDVRAAAEQSVQEAICALRGQVQPRAPAATSKRKVCSFVLGGRKRRGRAAAPAAKRKR